MELLNQYYNRRNGNLGQSQQNDVTPKFFLPMKQLFLAQSHGSIARNRTLIFFRILFQISLYFATIFQLLVSGSYFASQLTASSQRTLGVHFVFLPYILVLRSFWDIFPSSILITYSAHCNFYSFTYSDKYSYSQQ